MPWVSLLPREILDDYRLPRFSAHTILWLPVSCLEKSQRMTSLRMLRKDCNQEKIRCLTSKSYSPQHSCLKFSHYLEAAQSPALSRISISISKQQLHHYSQTFSFQTYSYSLKAYSKLLYMQRNAFVQTPPLHFRAPRSTPPHLCPRSTYPSCRTRNIQCS
jgi:hypothetical protein